MQTAVIVSTFTAFVVSFSGALGVVAASGNEVNNKAIFYAAMLGLGVAAKDLRSFYKLPPINGHYKPKLKYAKENKQHTDPNNHP